MESVLSKSLFGSYFDQDWHMQPSERVAVLHLLQRLKPKLSIEIGTFRGGSLRPISRLSNKVITFDIDPNQHRIAPLFPNTRFVTGDTANTLPPEIERMNSEPGLEWEFILIDGSHETDGVTSDINNCLRYIPKNSPCFIVMHDSSNPAVRKGIRAADWSDCKYFHALDLDYVPGQLYSRVDIKDQVWGGLGLGLLLPEERQGEPQIQGHFEYSLEAFSYFVRSNRSK